MRPRKPAASPDDFTAAMQELSREAAAKTLPETMVEDKTSRMDAAVAQLGQDFQNLTNRFEVVQNALAVKLEKVISEIPKSDASDWNARFQKIEEQLNAIRGSESVNHRLFDSLHDELLKYRDNFLHESLQKPFIHDLVMLFDDLTSLSEQFRTAAEREPDRGKMAQWRDNLENAIHSLVEILHRFEVKEIESRERVDRAVHKVINYEPADFPEEDGCIVMRIRRGFFWRGKLIRPEEVIAKRFG